MMDRRIRMFASVAAMDREILAAARAAIDRSLQILRESTPETYLGRNYYERIPGRLEQATQQAHRSAQ